ncbi:hypothetical protein IT418_00805, partial [bacterium]|nr:hypothetical protein [bacterium]
MIKTSRQSPAALLLLLIIGLFFTFSSVFGKVLAATTDTIAFQSKLVNSDGTNITNNTYNFRFRIYDASTSGTLLWSEDQALVVTDGVVSAQLGSVTPITSTVFAEPDVYLQVCFDANGTTGDSSNTNCDTVTHRYEEVFSTRKPITAVPVALGAKYLLDGSGNALGHNSFFKQGGNSFGSAGIVGTLDNYELKFYTNNTQKMVLTTSGKLGIGTVTPTAELEVAGNSGPVKLSTTLLGDPGTSTIFGKNVFRAQSTTTPSWTTAYDIDENYISSLLFDYENDILYVGTGGDGEIYRCPLSSDCDVAGDFTVVADPTDDPITDMVMSEASNLIFAVSGNRLYRCATSSNCDVGGDWTEVASGLDDTIEALVVDTTNNILYVGLGNTNGYILRCNITSTDCDAGSDFTLSFDSATASGFFSLVFDSSNGVLYAGSQSGTGFFRCEISTGCDASVDWTNPDAVTEDKVFDLIIDTENGVLYGTADDEIYRCDLSTNCDAAGDFTTSFDTPSVEVAVITYDPVHNRLFAGSYDSAIIYQCSTSTGCDEDSDWTTSVDVAEDSIEALEANKETGVVYAGTWTSALLLRFDDTSSETYAEYAYVGAKAVDTAGGSEDGLLTLSTLVNGTATDTLNVTGGNVGIGTVAPNARLEVTATAGEQLRLAYTSGSVYTGFSVDSSGNLLVNNTGTKTTFADTIVSNTGISVLESTGATYFTTFIGGDQSADITYTLPTASSNGVLTNTGGVLSWGAGGGGGISQVGSMTSSTVFGDATADDDWLGLGASAGRIAFDDQTVDYVNILNANVGIGTTAPAAMLDIQGVATEAVLGGEYITATADRDFSSDTGNWTGTNWSVTGGELIHTAGANVVTLQNSALTAAPAANDIIQLIFAANTTTAGVVTVNIGGSVQQIEFGRAVENRVYTATFVAVNSTVLTITPDSSWEGTIDDVSVKLFTMSDVTQYLRNADGTVGLELRSGGTGSLSNFIGSEAGRLNTTGDRNLAVGIQALYSNTTGARNTAIGYQSLRRTTIGIGNTGLGAMTLRQNTIGYENTAIGEMTMYYNVSGYWNTAIGSNTLRESRTGFGNTALGGQALLNLITGNNNTATGTNSLYSLTSGDLNTVLGDNSGYSLVVGSQNILIGQSAASNLSSGSGNIIIGNDIEAVNSTGSNQLNIGNLIFGTNIDGVDSTISSGNIGIGVKTPGQKLSVAGSLGILETGASPQYYTIFQGGDQSGNITYTLPTSSSNGVLTNAGGVLSWGAGGGGGISQVGSMTASSVFADSSADGNWLGLGATAGRIEFDSDGIDRV